MGWFGLGNITGAIEHNTWEVARNTTGELVAQANKKSINANLGTGEHWMGDVSNNGLFKGMRERFLRNPNSPTTIPLKDGVAGPARSVETQTGVGNRYAGFRANIETARNSMKSNIQNLEGDLAAATDDTTKTAYLQALAGARKDLAGLGTRGIMSYGEQVGAHALRTLKWTQEGPGMDRLVKSAAVGGAWMGGNTAMRGMSGGGLTYNNNGERDIAGIPFL